MKTDLQTLVDDAKDQEMQVVIWSGRTMIRHTEAIAINIESDGTIRKRANGEPLSLAQARRYLRLEKHHMTEYEWDFEAI